MNDFRSAHIWICIFIIICLIVVVGLHIKQIGGGTSVERFSDASSTAATVDKSLIESVYKQNGIEKCSVLDNNTPTAASYLDILRFRKWKPSHDTQSSIDADAHAQNSVTEKCYFYNDDSKILFRGEEENNRKLSPVKDPVGECAQDAYMFKDIPFIKSVYQDTTPERTLHESLAYNKCIFEIDKTKVNNSNLDAFWDRLDVTKTGSMACTKMLFAIKHEQDQYIARAKEIQDYNLTIKSESQSVLDKIARHLKANALNTSLTWLALSQSSSNCTDLYNNLQGQYKAESNAYLNSYNQMLRDKTRLTDELNVTQSNIKIVDIDVKNLTAQVQVSRRELSWYQGEVDRLTSNVKDIKAQYLKCISIKSGLEQQVSNEIQTLVVKKAKYNNLTTDYNNLQVKAKKVEEALNNNIILAEKLASESLSVYNNWQLCACNYAAYSNEAVYWMQEYNNLTTRNNACVTRISQLIPEIEYWKRKYQEHDTQVIEYAKRSNDYIQFLQNAQLSAAQDSFNASQELQKAQCSMNSHFAELKSMVELDLTKLRIYAACNATLPPDCRKVRWTCCRPKFQRVGYEISIPTTDVQPDSKKNITTINLSAEQADKIDSYIKSENASHIQFQDKSGQWGYLHNVDSTSVDASKDVGYVTVKGLAITDIVMGRLYKYIGATPPSMILPDESNIMPKGTTSNTKEGFADSPAATTASTETITASLLGTFAFKPVFVNVSPDLSIGDGKLTQGADDATLSLDLNTFSSILYYMSAPLYGTHISVHSKSGWSPLYLCTPKSDESSPSITIKGSAVHQPNKIRVYSYQGRYDPSVRAIKMMKPVPVVVDLSECAPETAGYLAEKPTPNYACIGPAIKVNLSNRKWNGDGLFTAVDTPNSVNKILRLAPTMTHVMFVRFLNPKFGSNQPSKTIHQVRLNGGQLQVRGAVLDKADGIIPFQYTGPDQPGPFVTFVDERLASSCPPPPTFQCSSYKRSLRVTDVKVINDQGFQPGLGGNADSGIIRGLKAAQAITIITNAYAQPSPIASAVSSAMTHVAVVRSDQNTAVIHKLLYYYAKTTSREVMYLSGEVNTAAGIVGIVPYKLVGGPNVEVALMEDVTVTNDCPSLDVGTCSHVLVEQNRLMPLYKNPLVTLTGWTYLDFKDKNNVRYVYGLLTKDTNTIYMEGNARGGENPVWDGLLSKLKDFSATHIQFIDTNNMFSDIFLLQDLGYFKSGSRTIGYLRINTGDTYKYASAPPQIKALRGFVCPSKLNKTFFSKESLAETINM